MIGRARFQQLSECIDCRPIRLRAGHGNGSRVWNVDAELGEALKKIVAHIGSGMARAQIIVSGQPVGLSPATKHHLLRIGQEAITNAVRHAAAKTILIKLTYGPEGVSLGVSDDGNGFVPSEVLDSGIGHFGLRGLARGVYHGKCRERPHHRGNR